MWLLSCAEFRPGHIQHMDGAVMLCAAHDDFRPGDRGKGRGITDMIDVIVTDDNLPHRFVASGLQATPASDHGWPYH